MIKRTLTAITAGAVMSLSAMPAQADGHGITVAYFLEWPMPFQFAKAEGTYDEALGVPVSWLSFDTGTAMFAAMGSGDVDIAVSLGAPPFAIAFSAGQDIQVVDVAVSYSENDNCVVAAGLEIDKSSAAELAGKKVAVPLGTAAHYGFLRQMSHFDVDTASLEVVNMAPPDGAAAIAQGAVDMACGWGGALRRMKEHGNVLLTGAEKEELGILVFDITAVRSEFLAENSEIVEKFVEVTAAANKMWSEEINQAEMIEVIAKDSGMDLEGAQATIETFVFPSVEDQLSSKWLGGGAQEFMKAIADVFVDAGAIDAALDSYTDAVNSGPLESAAAMMK